MATRNGSFKSPKISIPFLVLPGLNVYLISCAQLCADLQCWIVLNGTRGYMYDKGENKLRSLQTLGNLFILELGLQPKSRCLVTLFLKSNINAWHRRLGHASVETLRKLGFHGDLDDCYFFPQEKLKLSKFSRWTSYAQQLLERFHSDVMELIKKEQRMTQASLVYLRNDGAKDCKTKVLQDFLRQEGSVMILP